MHLALVIPALNEEEAIADTLRRALAARGQIVARTPVEKVTIVFVNDGSTDRTQDIVEQSEFAEVLKILFEKNVGYGAAIKAGWDATDADLLGFIDADGTCDPSFCVDLVTRLCETESDVVLASRLNRDSKMPLVRRIGNSLFALLLRALSHQQLTDTASGFRIVRRSRLKYMSPLPDGLHFTPAMSAICLLDPRLSIVEVPFAYQERVGRSKLNVIVDGIRFLYIIIFSACCYTPLKTMVTAGFLTAGGLGLVGLILRLSGVRSGPLLVLAFGGVLILLMSAATGIICHELNFLLLGPRTRNSVLERLLQRTMHQKRLIVIGLLIASAGIVGLLALPLAGPDHESWQMAPLVTSMTLIVLGTAAALGGVITRVIWAVGAKQRAILADETAAEPVKPESPVKSRRS